MQSRTSKSRKADNISYVNVGLILPKNVSKFSCFRLLKDVCKGFKICDIGNLIWKEEITLDGKRLFKNRIRVKEVYTQEESAQYKTVILILKLSEVEYKDNGRQFSLHGFDAFFHASINGTVVDSPAINLTVTSKLSLDFLVF